RHSDLRQWTVSRSWKTGGFAADRGDSLSKPGLRHATEERGRKTAGRGDQRLRGLGANGGTRRSRRRRKSRDEIRYRGGKEMVVIPGTEEGGGAGCEECGLAARGD